MKKLLAGTYFVDCEENAKIAKTRTRKNFVAQARNQ